MKPDAMSTTEYLDYLDEHPCAEIGAQALWTEEPLPPAAHVRAAWAGLLEEIRDLWPVWALTVLCLLAAWEGLR